jgi:hypothetical protein
MTTSNTTPTAAHLNLLAALTDGDLLAPIATGSIESTPTPAPITATVPTLPSLEALLAQAAQVPEIDRLVDLPARAQPPGAVPDDENVSHPYRAKGTGISEGLRLAIGDRIKTVADLDYGLRVFAAHALRSLIGARYAELRSREAEVITGTDTGAQEKVRRAALGEVAAVQASAHLSAAEFKYLLELVDTDRSGMAQNLAGPDVDVKALAAGRGLDWRSLATEWAASARARATVTFEAVKTDAGWYSYNIEVQPGAGWVLSVHSDSTWIPLEASAPAMARAIAERNRVMGVRAQAAKGAPYLGAAFPDTLRGVL